MAVDPLTDDPEVRKTACSPVLLTSSSHHAAVTVEHCAARRDY